MGERKNGGLLMTSAVLIVPAASLDAANALGELMGWGPCNYTVPLGPTPTGPVTHWGCRAEVQPGYFDLIANPPPEARPVLAVLIADYRETDDPHQHAMDVLAAHNLFIVEAAE